MSTTKSIQQLGSESVLYGFSSIVGRVLNYLLVPFYTSVFSPAEYGTVTVWYAYAAFLQVLYTYGMETTYFRFAARGEAQYFYAATSLLIVTSSLFSGILALLAAPIAQGLGHPGTTHYVYYFAAILSVDAVMVVPLARLRLQQQALLFVGIKLLQILLNVFLNLVWLYGLPHIYAGEWWPQLQPWIAQWYDPAHRVAYVFRANLVANAATIPLVAQAMYPFKWCLSWQYIRPILRYALPLFLMGLAGTANEMFSRAALQHWLPADFYPGQSNAAILGIFGACYKLSIFMSLGIQAFRYAAEPFFFAQAKNRQAPALFSLVMYWFVVVGCFVLLATSINLELLGYLLLRRGDYHMALPTVPYLLLAHLLLGIYYNLSIWFKITDQVYYGIAITSLGAVITVVGNMLLIPSAGYWGSVWATLASYTTMSGVCYYWGQRRYPIPYRLKIGLGYIMGTMLFTVLANTIPYPSFTSAVVSNLLLTIVFGSVLYIVAWRWAPRPIR
ncbi:MAG: oligosaccharide flippase family protein [Bacteroidota bacterium]